MLITAVAMLCGATIGIVGIFVSWRRDLGASAARTAELKAMRAELEDNPLLWTPTVWDSLLGRYVPNPRPRPRDL